MRIFVRFVLNNVSCKRIIKDVEKLTQQCAKGRWLRFAKEVVLMRISTKSLVKGGEFV